MVSIIYFKVTQCEKSDQMGQTPEKEEMDPRRLQIEKKRGGGG